MPRLTLVTAGESHGPLLTGILTGLPAGLGINPSDVNADLARRQHGYGRGGRMKIERDEARFTGGLRGGVTLGGPVAFMIENRDHAVWEKVMGPLEVDAEAAAKRRLSSPRPGHADLAGGLKYARRDLRDVLERASARESAARVAAGALCRQLLAAFGVRVRSGVLSLGAVSVPEGPRGFDDLERVDEASPFRAVDRSVEAAMTAAVDAAAKAGDTLGGTILVGARGVPAGLGSHVSWEDKLDGRIARALLSIPSVKGISLGEAVANAGRPGSEAHDAILWSEARGFFRATNRAGGLEGGITNGEDVLATLYQKPIATLREGLPSVDVDTKQPHRAAYERSDVTAVPACGVIGEAMLAFVLADALLEKTGGDSMEECKRNFDGFVRAQKSY
ncbi:MAG TPA: chorismate synthase [Thermoanaerobaculia bacterium]|nr:chorismate synthase [Thermoanaerobaculia bacterium]